MKFIGKRVVSFLFLFALATSAGGQAGPSPAVQLRYVTVLVKDQNEALRWYTDVLGLTKVEDAPFGPGMRWLVVAGEGKASPGIVLELASTAAKSARMGKETNWVFRVSDCFAFYEQLRAKGVHFTQPATRQPWGTVQAMFEDPYGNIFVAESSSPTVSGASASNP
jgi:catechol 2,3-dioxygenase-like lactoylglutathione lyase family enzyme